MKVYLVNSVCGVGSTGTMVSQMVRLLRENADQGRVGFGIGKARDVLPAEAFCFNHKLGYFGHNLLSRFTDHAGWYSSAQTRRLIRDMEKFQPDVVHLHNLHGYYVNYKMLFRYLDQWGGKVVWTLHDCWSFTGHCTHYADCVQWRSGCTNCPRLREYPVCYTKGDVQGNFAAKKAAFTGVKQLHLVTPCRWLAGEVSRSFLGDFPVHVICNGVDGSVFQPQKRNNGDKKQVLGVANVWSARKGLKDFCRLAEILPEEYEITLVGLTQEQIAQLPGNIRGILHTQNRQQLAALYVQADVFVDPTYEDTYPTTHLEAQMCHTPVISYRVGGCEETIQPGCGETVALGDIHALAAAVKKWCEYSGDLPVDRQALEQKRCCREYYDLYRHLTGK